MKPNLSLSFILTTFVILTSCKNNNDDITITKSNFMFYHPCGIAISNSGKVAVSTYEGDTENGQIFIWNSFADFDDEKPSNYYYTIKDPEAVQFDNSDNLYIADTYDSKIYFTTDISKAPTHFFYIGNGAASPTNPRGMSFDQTYNYLYVMCENLYPETKSYIQVVHNPTLETRTFYKLTGSDQSAGNALDVFFQSYPSRILTTDYQANKINIYAINAPVPSSISVTKTLINAGGVLNVVADQFNAYFTNDGGYLVKWNIATNTTNYISIGGNGNYTPWGIALYGGNLYIADAPHNKITVVNPATANWQ